jgi:hypothetical protein
VEAAAVRVPWLCISLLSISLLSISLLFISLLSISVLYLPPQLAVTNWPQLAATGRKPVFF